MFDARWHKLMLANSSARTLEGIESQSIGRLREFKQNWLSSSGQLTIVRATRKARLRDGICHSKLD
jgi:hypothetical protein